MATDTLTAGGWPLAAGPSFTRANHHISEDEVLLYSVGGSRPRKPRACLEESLTRCRSRWCRRCCFCCPRTGILRGGGGMTAAAAAAVVGVESGGAKEKGKLPRLICGKNFDMFDTHVPG